MADTTTQTSVETKEDFGLEPAAQVTMWLSHIKAYEKQFKDWQERSGKIIKRYRDEMLEGSSNTTADQSRKFNILWSNIETLKPAMYSRTPKVSVQRRNKDRDTVAMAAAEILQRSTQFSSEETNFDDAMKSTRDDYLLTARGQVWVYYEPEYGEQRKADAPVTQGEDGTYLHADGKPVEDASGVKEDGGAFYIPEGGDPYQPVVNEKVCVKHILWRDFGHTCSPSWDKVTAVWKTEQLTRDQLVKRFAEKGKAVQLTKTMTGIEKETADKFGDVFKRAEVHEIWDKDSRKAIWISPGYTEGPLDTLDDPLGLKDFFPCPKPMYGTTTTDTMIPVPDYAEYQSQAMELDVLTKRIDKLAEACRVTGAYDASFPALQNILTGTENTLVPVDKWAMFATQGGLEGAISFVPIKQVAEVLKILIETRNVIKQDLYEITGLSDLVRGQGQHDATATAERIKNQFVSLRLKDRQSEMERFARDTLRLMAEILSEHVAPEKLLEISGWLESPNARSLDREAQQQQQQILAAQMQQQQAAAQAQQPQLAGPDGQPMVPPQQPSAQPPVPQQPQAPLMSAQMVAQMALKLLKDDRVRTFKVSIETDSIIIADEQEQQKNHVEFLTATSSFLQQALPALEKFPKIAPLLGEMLMFGVRGFKIGTQLEDVFEAAINDIEGLEPMGQKDNGEAGKLMIEGKKVEADIKDKNDRLVLEHQKFQAEEGQRQHERDVAAQTFQAEEAQRVREHEIKMEELKIQGLSLKLQLQKIDLDLQNADRSHERAVVDGDRSHELEQKRLDDEKQARLDERAHVIDDRRMDGKITPTMEEEVQEVRSVMVPLAEAVTKMASALDAITERMENNHSDMVHALTAPRKLIRDDRNQLIGSEMVQ